MCSKKTTNLSPSEHVTTSHVVTSPTTNPFQEGVETQMVDSKGTTQLLVVIEKVFLQSQLNQQVTNLRTSLSDSPYISRVMFLLEQ